MGILNVTPDSFSDGANLTPQQFAEKGRLLAEQGADILDIGGESSRPGSDPISAEEELRRVIPVLQLLRPQLAIPISVDTTKAEVAEAALQAGADILNDISALQGDSRMETVCQKYGCPVVLMHRKGDSRTMQQNPTYVNVVQEVTEFFRKRMNALTIPQEEIILDPGIGFGKKLEHNLALLQSIPQLCDLGRPVLIGLSRKRFLGEITGRAPSEREFASSAAHALCVARGAHILRAHNVMAARDAALVGWAMRTS
jgi:dihydropteroate synthase